MTISGVPTYYFMNMDSLHLTNGNYVFIIIAKLIGSLSRHKKKTIDFSVSEHNRESIVFCICERICNISKKGL